MGCPAYRLIDDERRKIGVTYMIINIVVQKSILDMNSSKCPVQIYKFYFGGDIQAFHPGYMTIEITYTTQVRLAICYMLS